MDRDLPNADLHRLAGDLATLADHAPDIIARFDRQLRHLYVNPAVTAATGRPPEDFIGKTNEELGMPTDLCRLWRGVLNEVFAQARPASLEFSFPGTDDVRHYSMRAVPEPDAQGNVRTALIITRDVTEQRRAEEVLRTTTTLSQALNRLNESVHASLDYDDILQQVVQIGAVTLGSESAAVSIRHPRGWQIRQVYGMPVGLVGAVMSDDEERHAMLACEQGRPVAVADARGDPRVNADHLARHGIQSVLVAPLTARRMSLGVLFFNFHRTQRAFTSQEIDFARQLAGTAANALENARLFRLTQETKEQLRASQEQLRRAMEAGGVFSFEWDCRTDTVWRSFNAASILGVEGAEEGLLPAAAHLERIHPDDRRALQRVFRGLTPEANAYNKEYRYLCANGRTLWLEESGQAEFDEGGDMVRVQGIVADVTARVAAREQDTRQAAALAAAQSAVDTINAMGEGVALLGMDGRIRTVNPAFARLTEYAPGDLEGRSVEALLPDLFEGRGNQVNQTLARIRLKQSRKDALDALAATTRSGARVWVVPTVSSIYGKDNEPVGIVLTLRDVSPLIEVQCQLRESECKYRELVEGANAIIVRVNADQRITFVNEYAEAFFGYGPGELLGRLVVGSILPEYDAQGNDLRRFTDAMLRHPELHGSVDSENLRKDGARVWVHWSNRGVRDARGDVAEVLCIGTDITRRIVLEREAATYRQRLKDLANRLIASEEQERRRVATHLHDTVIQTLSLSAIRLGGVRAAVEKAGLTAPGERIDGIRQLLDQGIRECRELMGELVPPLLYEIGLAAALHDFAERQGLTDPTPIRVSADAGIEPLDVEMRGLLFQCARELVMNALKHAGPCEIQIAVGRIHDRIFLEVRDTGRGFEPDSIDQHDAPQRKGGFGFFNIRERLEGLGGTLRIQSAPGRGSIVRIEVPAGRGARDEP